MKLGSYFLGLLAFIMVHPAFAFSVDQGENDQAGTTTSVSLDYVALKSPKEARIAILVPESGPYALYGELLIQGFQLAESKFRPKEFLLHINRYNSGRYSSPAEVQGLLKTLRKWQPDIIIGPYTSERTKLFLEEGLASIAPVLVPSAVDDALTRLEGRDVFRLASPALELARTLVGFLQLKHTSQPIRRLLIFAEDSEFADEVVGVFQSLVYEKVPVNPVVFPLSNETDLREAMNIPEQPGTVAVVVSRSGQASLMLTEAFKGKATVIGVGGAFLTPFFRDIAARRGLSPYVVSPWNPVSEMAESRKFTELFVEKFGSPFDKGQPDYHVAQAYTSFQVAIAALKNAHTGAVSVRDALKALSLPTSMGVVQFLDFEGFYNQNRTSVLVERLEGETLSVEYPEEFALTPKVAPKSTAPKESTSSKNPIDVILGNQTFALFAILALGLVIGSFEILGISLGASGVIFVSLLFGHLGYTIPGGIGTLGLVLFIYCVGLGAGPSFFSVFARQGKTLAQLSIIIVASGGFTVYAASQLFNVPPELMVGIFAGALTSTPGLAAALDAASGASSPALVSVGYGIAYPFGVIGVVLFIQLIPRLMKRSLEESSEERPRSTSAMKIKRVLVEVTNEKLFGKPISSEASRFISQMRFHVSRILMDDKLVPLDADMVYEEGLIVLLVGDENNIDSVVPYLGRRSEKVVPEELLNSARERTEVVVTAPEFVGKSFSKLNIFGRFGVIITRITRMGNSFVPSGETIIERGDTLVVVGLPEKLQRFSQAVGHKAKAIHETDTISLMCGVLAGLFVGMLPLSLPGTHSITLGFTGGCLVVSLLLGHFGRIGRVVGRVPVAAQIILRDLGLMLFLAQAGIQAGSSFVSVVQQYGISLFLVGALTTTLPLLFGMVIGMRFYRLSFLQTLGAICGGMTSTPALGAITAKTDAETPVISYAAAYPVAMVVVIVVVQVLTFLAF